MTAKQKRHFPWTTVLLILIFMVGLGLMLYPTVSDYWNSLHQSVAIASYVEKVATMDDEVYKKMWDEAVAYNKDLAKDHPRWHLSEEQEKEYESILDVSGTGIMGYVEVPKIKVSLPIYHGVDEATLQIAIGHMEGSSFPVGGKSTHCVISGHRGLPSAKLFSDLDELEVGDTFMVRILDETLTYEVEEINIVLPTELELLDIQDGKDLMTLVTCTPYGINTHRLLVRGHRIATTDDTTIRVTADGMQVSEQIVGAVLALPISLIVIIWLLISYSKGSQERKKLKTR